jgi:hypothetical protein
VVKRNSANTWITPTTTNEVTTPAQPAFLAARTAATVASVTGDGTVYTLGSGANVLAEIFDQNSDFASPTFTAPITGRYSLTYNVSTTDSGAPAGTSYKIEIVTSNGTYRMLQVHYSNFAEANSGTHAASSLLGGVLCDMDAADTATITLTVAGGAKSVNLLGGVRCTCFSGSLIC